MAARRLKLVVILGVLLPSALALVAWTQVWIEARLDPSGSATRSLDVTGATAAPALTALALAGVALAGALSIAGPVIRVVLGLLEILMGFSVALAAVLAMIDPAGSSAALVTANTGIAGRASIADGVSATVSTPWPYAALLAGVMMIAAGIAVLVTGRRWPAPGSRYQAVRFESAPVGSGNAVPSSESAADAADAVDAWDGLTRGEDPTTGR